MGAGKRERAEGEGGSGDDNALHDTACSSSAHNMLHMRCIHVQHLEMLCVMGEERLELQHTPHYYGAAAVGTALGGHCVSMTITM